MVEKNKKMNFICIKYKKFLEENKFCIKCEKYLQESKYFVKCYFIFWYICIGQNTGLFFAYCYILKDHPEFYNIYFMIFVIVSCILSFIVLLKSDIKCHEKLYKKRLKNGS